MGCLTDQRQGFRSREDAGRFDCFASNCGFGVAQRGAKDLEMGGMRGRVEGKSSNGEGSDGGGGVTKGGSVGFGGGLSL